MAATLTQPTRHSDGERERLRRRRDRHARLATDRALTETAFTLRARERQARDLDRRVARELAVQEQIRAPERPCGQPCDHAADPTGSR
jgi:hypothetical protein